MAKTRSRALDYGVYLLVRVVVMVIQIFSLSAARTLANHLAWLAYHVNRRHRLVAMENLRHAFPDLDDSARDRLVRATYRHLAAMLMEMILLPRVLNARNLENHIRYANDHDFDRVVALVNSGRPLMALTGHFGNWEILSYAIGLFGIRGCAVARRLDNPYLDHFLSVFRQKTGIRLLDKKVDYPRILGTLAGGGMLGMVGDQDAGVRGMFVSYFGRPASTFKSIALLSLEYSAPILVMGAARVSMAPLRYEILLEDLILPEEYAHHSDAARRITQRYTEALERMVRRNPDQYFWLHRRWKHEPPVRKSKAAA